MRGIKDALERQQGKRDFVRYFRSVPKPKPRRYEFEQLVCPCNSISDFPTRCPYHDREFYQPAPVTVITTDSTTVNDRSLYPYDFWLRHTQ